MATLKRCCCNITNISDYKYVSAVAIVVVVVCICFFVFLSKPHLGSRHINAGDVNPQLI